MADWVCPRCGRSFRRHNQRHSCQTQTVEALFHGHPRASALNRLIQGVLEDLGRVQAEVTKSQVAFRAGEGRRFCWVWRPPEGVKGIADDAVVVSFSLPRALDSPRVRQVVEPQPGTFMHHIVIDDEAQVDDEVVGWLREAWTLAARQPSG